MPGFDGTGPLGSGPMTGWGLGPCGAGMAWRRGGRFWGRGLGWQRFGAYRPWGYPAAPVDKKDEAEMLKENAGYLEEELRAIKARLDELESAK